MPGACTCPGGRPPCIPSGIGLPHGAACWPAAAGSRTACHPSFHTCPSSHTVGSGPNTGRKVRGVPGVPPVGAHKPRRARRAVRPGARGNCPGARRRACRRRARAAARQHLANEAGGEAAPAARQLVAGQLRARHAVPERELLHALAKIGRVAAAGCARERGDMQWPSLLTSHRPESGLTMNGGHSR